MRCAQRTHPDVTPKTAAAVVALVRTVVGCSEEGGRTLSMATGNTNGLYYPLGGLASSLSRRLGAAGGGFGLGALAFVTHARRAKPTLSRPR